MKKNLTTEEKEVRRLYNKKYREENKVKISEQRKKYREENKLLLSEYSINYIIENKIKISEQRKKYYNNNSEKEKSNNKLNYEKNKEVIKLKQKIYYIKNYEKIKERKLLYVKDKNKNDILYRLTSKVRNMIRESFRYRIGFKKTSKTQEILGCSFVEFKIYLESKFEPWMTWENRGLYNGTEGYGWDIDHIIPLSTAKTEEDIIKLNHFSNLQPLCGYINRVIKRDNVISSS